MNACMQHDHLVIIPLPIAIVNTTTSLSKVYQNHVQNGKHK